MKRIALLLCSTTLLALLLTADLLGQGTGDPEKMGSLPTVQGANAEGTHFIVGFMQNEESTSICTLLDGREIP
ncbi:MAG: hypothetical protein AB7H80_15765, partial [Candidatus Kapaibacterium sp.]